MLTSTGLYDELDESSVWLFSQVINYQAIKQMPPKSNPECREKLKKCSPELFTFIISPTSDEEDAIKCNDLGEVAESVEMSKEDLIQLIVDAGIQKSYLAKDLTATFS